MLSCLSIDDDPLFARKLKVFTDEMDWLEIKELFHNPIQGATAILQQKPDVVFVDIEMPYMDGEYLVDWLQPTLKQLAEPPRIVVISSVYAPPQALLEKAEGFINKSEVSSRENLEKHLKEILLGI